MNNFLKVKKTVQAPCHIGLGSYIEITCDGITSLRADQVGTEMNFLDINKAQMDGYFGKNPRIRGDKDWSLLIDYLSGGIEFTPEEWDTSRTNRKFGPPSRMQGPRRHQRLGATS